VRILNPNHFGHSHDKLIVVDGRQGLVSSQNWSDYAVSKNREAEMLIDYPELARYYSTIFQSE
jgi:phosphatidylserine/phosphatidylglycerophosphate/cardiolipin synthase-like enzyme